MTTTRHIRTPQTTRALEFHRAAITRHVSVSAVASLLIVLPGGCAMFDAWAKPPGNEPLKPLRLRVHLASGERQPDMELQADERGLPVFIAPEPLATERNVDFASVADNARQHLVLLYFTPDAAERLAEATRTALRGARGAARLAVFLEDKLVMSGYLKAPIADGRLLLDGDFSARRAADIAERLNAYRAAMYRDPPPD